MTQRFAVVRPSPVFSEFGPAYMVALADDAVADVSMGTDVATIEVPASFERAVPARVRGFVAGRHCATHALARLGQPHTTPVPQGPMGAPHWPEGITGSITHSPVFAAAVASPQQAWRSVGIDCERIMRVDTADDIAARIMPEAERLSQRAELVGTLPWPTFVTAVFSAKESVYKCLNPVCGTFFGFEACQLVSLDAHAGSMRLVLPKSPGPGVPAGLELLARYEVRDDHVFTGVGWLPTP